MKFQNLGDNSLILKYSSEELMKSPAIVRTHYNYLKKNLTTGIRDVVLCYSSIGLYFDNLLMTHQKVEADVRLILSKILTDEEVKSKEITIPVFYGGKYGPDLEAAAEMLKITSKELIFEHSSHKYTVFGIGFLPGFPYMGPLPEKLVIPRKSVPAPSVTAGSVAIAGGQTGIYPFDSPGGWHVIGWTPIKMFDVNQNSPAYLETGDVVTFEPRR